MKNIILIILVSFSWCCLPSHATDKMVIKLKDGTIFHHTVAMVDEVVFESNNDASLDALEFSVLTDSTVAVSSYNYEKSKVSVVVPEKVILNDSVYTVTTISEDVFSEYDIKSVELPSTITTIERFAFTDCHLMTDVEIPYGVAEIGNYAFAGCRALIKLIIPSTVKMIASHAFDGCINLDIVIDNSEDNVKVGDKVFFECKSVTWLK